MTCSGDRPECSDTSVPFRHSRIHNPLNVSSARNETMSIQRSCMWQYEGYKADIERWKRVSRIPVTSGMTRAGGLRHKKDTTEFYVIPTAGQDRNSAGRPHWILLFSLSLSPIQHHPPNNVHSFQRCLPWAVSRRQCLVFLNGLVVVHHDDGDVIASSIPDAITHCWKSQRAGRGAVETNDSSMSVAVKYKHTSIYMQESRKIQMFQIGFSGTNRV